MSEHSGWKRWRGPAFWLGGFVLFALFITLNRDFETFIRYLTLGLPQGSIIALIAVGYSMVYGIIQLINFAHGEVFMFSCYFLLLFIAPFDQTSVVRTVVLSGLLVVLLSVALNVGLGGLVPRARVRAPLALAAGGLAAAGLMALVPAPGAAPVVPFLVAQVLAVGLACCLGVSMDALAYRPLRHSPRLIPLITAIGLSLVFANLVQSLWGSSSRFFPAAQVPGFYRGVAYEVPGIVRISVTDGLIMGLALVLMGSLQLFIHKTRTGKAMRACAQDRTTASLMGIRVNHVVALAFALGAGLAALVAPLYVLRGNPIAPQMGYIVGILAFASAVLGGIGNITGAMLGGMIIGIIYNFVPLFDALPTFRGFQWLEARGWVSTDTWNVVIQSFGAPSQYQLGVAYAFMILVIVFKPTGLLGRATAKRA